jgi:hypothetical protein
MARGASAVAVAVVVAGETPTAHPRRPEPKGASASFKELLRRRTKYGLSHLQPRQMRTKRPNPSPRWKSKASTESRTPVRLRLWREKMVGSAADADADGGAVAAKARWLAVKALLSHSPTRSLRPSQPRSIP